MNPPIDPGSVANLLREQMLDYPGARLYAVIDMARGEVARQALAAAGGDHRCLVQGELPAALQRVMPVLAVIGGEADDLVQYLEQGWGKGVGILLSSALDLEPLREHLGRQLVVGEGIETSLFRFYDARVAGAELAGGNPGRLAGALTLAPCLAAEGDGRVLVHLLQGERLHRWALGWSVSKRACASDGQGLEELAGELARARDEVEAARGQFGAAEQGAAGARARVASRLESVRGARVEGDARLGDLLEQSAELERGALAAQAEAAGAKGAAGETKQRMSGLAGAMGQNTMEVMTRYNRLRADGARLAMAIKAGEQTNANEEALAVVEAEMADLRAGIEEQKQAAAEHGELETRRQEQEQELERQEAEQTRLRGEAQQARQEAEDLEQRLDRLAARAEALEELTGGQAARGAGQDLDQAEAEWERQAAAVDSARDKLQQQAHGLEESRGLFNRAVANNNLQQKMAVPGPEQRDRTAEAGEQLDRSAKELRRRLEFHGEAARFCEETERAALHSAGQWLELARAARQAMDRDAAALEGALLEAGEEKI